MALIRQVSRLARLISTLLTIGLQITALIIWWMSGLWLMSRRSVQLAVWCSPLHHLMLVILA